MLIRSRPCFSCRSPFLPTLGACHAGMLILSADHRNHRLHYHISLFIIIICISLFIIIITIIIIIHAHSICLSRRNADLVCVQPIIIIHSIFIQLIFQPIEITNPTVIFQLKISVDVFVLQPVIIILHSSFIQLIFQPIEIF